MLVIGKIPLPSWRSRDDRARIPLLTQIRAGLESRVVAQIGEAGAIEPGAKTHNQRASLMP